MKKLLVFLFVSAFLASCATNNIDDPTPIQDSEAKNEYWTGPEFSSDYKSSSDATYSLRNVQKALDLLAGEGYTRAEGVTLQPTHHYVRFLPQNDRDIYILHDSLNLDIFHYPFDHELTPEELEFHLDIDKINGYGWQYCIVGSDFPMPTEMRWELLDYAYLQPDDEETITRSGNTYQLPADVYSAAIDKSVEITGTESDTPATRAGKWEPSGRLIYDKGPFMGPPAVQHRYLALPNVYVRANTNFNTGNTYTDSAGNFKISKGAGGAFRNKVHYMVIWYRADGTWKIHDSIGKADTKRSGDPWIKGPWNKIFGDDEFGFCANISVALNNFFLNTGPKKISSMNVKENYGKSAPSGGFVSSYVRGRTNPIEIYSYGINFNSTSTGSLTLSGIQSEIAYRLKQANQ
jgi:hypothetical protein